METRNVTLTLDKAKEFYNSGNNALKEIALQAFTEDELTTFRYTDIKTFEDACKALKLDLNKVYGDLDYISEVEGNLGKHLTAIYKLDIISKALNGADWNPRLVGGDDIYFSDIKIFREYGNNPSNNKRDNIFIADKRKYIVIGGCEVYTGKKGVADFNINFGLGIVDANLSLFCCKSYEIAEYMSCQFCKLIFEACYVQHIGAYKWID